MSDQVDEEIVDPIGSLRACVLSAVMPAIETLARAGRGEGVFQSIEHMRSCFVLARLAPLVLFDANRTLARTRGEQPDENEPIELDDEQIKLLRQLQRPFYGPPQPGWGILGDPAREPKWFSWADSCRRAGIDPHEVFEEQERYEQARTD